MQNYKTSVEGRKNPESQFITFVKELFEKDKPQTNVLTSTEDVLNKYRPEYEKSYTDINEIWKYFFYNEKPLTVQHFT